MVDGDLVYIAGFFSSAGGVTASNVARWNGSTWSALQVLSSNGTNDMVNALALGRNRIYVGSFNKVPIYLPIVKK